MAHAAGKRTRAAARSHVESLERTANLGVGGRMLSLAVWCWHRAKAAQDTARGLAGFEAFFRVGGCAWLAGAIERLVKDVSICRSEGHVGPRGAMTHRCAPAREPQREGLTADLGRNINQFFIEQGVSSAAFDEGSPIDLCRIESGDDREEYNLILRYFDYSDYKRRLRL
jgi:hypothetical protein